MAKAAEKYGLHTCWHCQNIVVDFRELIASPGEEVSEYLCFYKHKISGTEVLRAADEGCKLFAISVSKLHYATSYTKHIWGRQPGSLEKSCQRA